MPFPDPLVTSAHFLRPGSFGPAEIRTEVVRAGRRVATGQAGPVQEGRGRSSACWPPSATSRQAARAAPHVLNEAPRAPAASTRRPDVLIGGALPGVSITEQIEYRAPEPPGWAKGAPDGEAELEFWMRFRDGRERRPARARRAGRRRRARGARHRRARVGHDGADRARARPSGSGLARVPHDDAPRDRRVPRGGLRDLGLGRQPRGPVAPIRAASGVAPIDSRTMRGRRVDRASREDFHQNRVHQPRQIYASTADRRHGRRWTRRHRSYWLPAVVLHRWP